MNAEPYTLIDFQQCKNSDTIEVWLAHRYVPRFEFAFDRLDGDIVWGRHRSISTYQGTFPFLFNKSIVQPNAFKWLRLQEKYYNLMQHTHTIQRIALLTKEPHLIINTLNSGSSASVENTPLTSLRVRRTVSISYAIPIVGVICAATHGIMIVMFTKYLDALT